MKTNTFSSLGTGNAAARCNTQISSLRLAKSMSDHARLTCTTTLAGRAKRLLPVFVAAVIMMAAAPSTGSAQGLTIVSPQVGSPPCSDTGQCCTEFKLQMPAAGTYTAYISVDGNTDPSPSTCFDSACFVTQTGATFTHINGTNQYTVTWTSTGASDFIEFWLCGNGYCLSDYGLYNVFYYINPGGGTGELTLNSCGGTPGNPCLNCDYTRFWPDGEICLTRGMANACWATQVCFTFSNPLPPCVMSNLHYVPTDWTPTYTTDVNGYVTEICFNVNTLIGGTALPPCGTFCFQIGRCCSVNWRLHPPWPDSVCVDGGFTTMITGLSTDPMGTCNPANTSCSLNTGNLKRADGSGETVANGGANSQNYPNPMDASTGFKTTIPFVTSAGGNAIITIANENGVKVLTDDETILGAGTHYFYFSGKDLPSGTYYYTIEFPQGVTIANKTMLIVK
jgi:hypothetical protein